MRHHKEIHILIIANTPRQEIILTSVEIEPTLDMCYTDEC